MEEDFVRVLDIVPESNSTLNVSDEIEVGASISFILTPENRITPPMSADILVTRCDQLSDNEYQIAAEIVQIR